MRPVPVSTAGGTGFSLSPHGRSPQGLSALTVIRTGADSAKGRA